MTDLKLDKATLMHFIDGVHEQRVDREQIEQRVEMFAIMVADKQREQCALWVKNNEIMKCPLATDDFKEQ